MHFILYFLKNLNDIYGCATTIIIGGMSGNIGLPVDAGFFSLDRGKLSSLSEEVAKEIWVSALLTEYRILQLARYGVKPVAIDIKPIKQIEFKKFDWEKRPPEYYLFKIIFLLRHSVVLKGKEILSLYTTEENLKRLNISPPENCQFTKEEWKIIEYVMKSLEQKNPELLFKAEEILTKLYGDSGDIVSIPLYNLEAKELNITQQDYKRVEEISNELLRTLSPLGGRVRAELWKLIFSGYKQGITSTIEGLSDDERNYIEKLLDTPFDRASLIIAYGKIANIRNLLMKMTSTVINRTSVTPKILIDTAPPLTKIMT